MILGQFIILGAALFSLGVYGVLTRRNAVLVLLSVELMLAAVNINFVAFDVFVADAAAGRMSVPPPLPGRRRPLFLRRADFGRGATGTSGSLSPRQGMKPLVVDACRCGESTAGLELLFFRRGVPDGSHA